MYKIAQQHDNMELNTIEEFLLPENALCLVA